MVARLFAGHEVVGAMRPQVRVRGFSVLGRLRRESLSPELIHRSLPDYSATRFPAEIIGRERLPRIIPTREKLKVFRALKRR